MTPLAVLVPVLNRPHRVQPLMDAFAATTPGARLLFLADPGDQPERRALKAARAETVLARGGYAAKINRGVQMTDEPYVLLAADDLQPHDGWFDAARAHMRGPVEVIGLNDLRPRQFEHATHFLLSRAYCELPTLDGDRGPLCEAYTHNFCDRELVETARKRGAYAYAADAVMEHRHHLEGHAEFDATYRKGQQSFRRDGRLFRQRSHLWA